MECVKEIIKSAGLKQEEVINRLSLSKPTFYSYVKLYENNADIPRDRYKIIFHELFDDVSITPELFSEKLAWAERMLQRDSRFGIEMLSPGDADYAYKTLQLIREDIQKTDNEKSIYILINFLLSSYRKEPFFKYLARYFSFLNGAMDLSEIKEDDKVYMASFYECFRQLVNKEVPFDQKKYERFLDRCAEYKQNRDRETNKAKEQVERTILAIREENEKLGVEMNDSDLIKAVKERLDAEDQP